MKVCKQQFYRDRLGGGGWQRSELDVIEAKM